MTDSDRKTSGADAGRDFPEAALAPPRLAGLPGAAGMWLIAGVCVIAAIVLAVRAWRTPGPAIAVTFQHGYGIAPGDPVRLRGIDVGLVESVTMTDDLQQVQVGLRLSPEAGTLAREGGAQFWIQRPQVSLAAVRGLDTLVGPKYIAAQPGPADAAPQKSFVGVESPRQISETATIGITIRFRQGFGLDVGAPVRFRGVQIGEVVSVDLDRELGHVLVHAELRSSAQRLTREGSQFWVERPQVGVAQVRGLDTLLGGRYLSAVPGPSDGELQTEFEGLDAAPAESDSGGGIELVLESSTRHSLKAGSPVVYRGVTIGNVLRVGLSSDGTEVEARIYVQSMFRQLVRANTQFWNNSGLGLEIGLLKGVQLDAESLETIAAGGVSLATPDQVGKPVATGHRFRLADKADDEWLKWRPQIAIGRALLPEGLTTPAPIRASLRWQRRRFGLLRNEHRHAWTHPLQGRGLLCPLEGDLPSGLTLEVEGQTVEVTSDNVRRYGPLALIQGAAGGAESTWPPDRLRAVTEPENCLLLAGPDSIPVSVGRIQVDEEDPPQWYVDITVELTADWHGASVIAQRDGALIGLLFWDDGQAAIRPLGGLLK